jgi:hypothetical protein
MKKLFLLFAICILAAIPNIAQDTIHVPANYQTIQAAINAATNGDVVLVAENTYYENINFRGKAITVASLFLIDDSTKHISNTIINGSQPSHPDSGSVVIFSSGEDTTSVLYGFTITGGTGSSLGPVAIGGGGVNCHNSGAKILHNIIENNHVSSSTEVTNGGGIAGGPINSDSWIIVEYNTIRNNSVTNTVSNGGAVGGGISIYCNARVNNNIVEFNKAQATLGTAWGGGILFGASENRLRYCINNKIWYNKALSPTGTYIDGGVGGGLVIAGSPRAEIRLNDIRYNEVEGNVSLGIKSWGAGVLIQNQTSETIFSQNYVAFNKAINNSPCNGAGISIWNPEMPFTGGPMVINNIITNNTGGTHGGGVFTGGFVSNSAILINNTICNNVATNGGAIYVGYNSSNPSHPKIINSILWNNGTSIYVNTNSTVTVRYSDVEGGYTGEGNINFNPSFSDTLFNLADSSPCIGAGIDSIEIISGVWYYAPPICYFGGPRPNPSGSKPDMGACESPLDTPVVGIEEEYFHLRKFSLEQNYPNPFNPSTIISWQSPVGSHQTIKIFDVLGNEIATLVDEYKPAGRYEFEFNAEKLSSGIYFYQLRTVDPESSSGQAFIETKKMILLK